MFLVSHYSVLCCYMYFLLCFSWHDEMFILYSAQFFLQSKLPRYDRLSKLPLTKKVLTVVETTTILLVFKLCLSLPSLPSMSSFLLSRPFIHPILQCHEYSHKLVSRYHFSICSPDHDYLRFRKRIRFSKLVHLIIAWLTVELHIYMKCFPIFHSEVTLPWWDVVLIC